MSAQFTGIDTVNDVLSFGTEANPTGVDADDEFDVDDGSSMAIWRVSASGLAEDAVFRLNLNGDDGEVDTNYDMARVQISGAASGGGYKIALRIRIYDNVPGATSGVGATYLEAMKPIIAVDNTLSVTAAAAAAPLVAEVGAAFKSFSGASPNSGTLGNVHVSVARTHDLDGRGPAPTWMIMSAATGQPVNVGDVMASGGVVVAGDFSVGTFTVAGAPATLMDANSKELEKFTEGDNKGKYMDPSLAATASFAVSNAGALAMHPGAAATHVIVKAFSINVKDNDTAIPVGSYSATTSAKPKNPNAPAIADRAGQAIGAIIRNGTTVHIGYLTTYEGHNQRLVIVNRGPLMVDYELGDIVTEQGTTAMAGHMAAGEIMPKSSLVIQARDLVSFGDGGTTRASATLTLTAKPADVSVSTTLVNTMDRSTDTVSYK